MARSLQHVWVTGGGATPPEEPPAAAPPARYTRSLLRQTLQLLGCKPRLAHRGAEAAFRLLEERASLARGQPHSLAAAVEDVGQGACAVSVRRAEFEELVVGCLQAARRDSDPAALRADLRLACRLHEQRSSVTVLLCGTSGTGKSTLAALLASRLGITTVLSTDSVRHMLRSFSEEGDDPLLWASTYQAGACLQQQHGSAPGAQRDARKAAIQGYKAQSEAVVARLDRLIGTYEGRRQSLVVEGVHLSLGYVVRLMAAHPSVIPFLIHISNEAKHSERFAVRAKAMTLRPDGNRYVKHLRSIRAIQDYLCRAADTHAVPKVDNTNVDRSVATIHATLLGCMRRAAEGDVMLDPGSRTCKPVLEEYLKCRAATWSSRDMLDLIRKKSAAGEAASPSDGPSTSAASTPKGPVSEAAVLDDNRSFYADSASSAGSDAEGGGGANEGSSSSVGGGGGGGGGETAAATRHHSELGSVLEALPGDIGSSSDDEDGTATGGVTP